MASTEGTVETIYCQKFPGIKGKVRFHIVVVNNRADMTLGWVGGGRAVTNDDECFRLNQKWRERRVLPSVFRALLFQKQCNFFSTHLVHT